MFFFALCIWLLKSNEISGMLKKGQTTLQVWLKLVNNYDGDEVYLLENRNTFNFFADFLITFLHIIESAMYSHSLNNYITIFMVV